MSPFQSALSFRYSLAYSQLHPSRLSSEAAGISKHHRKYEVLQHGQPVKVPRVDLPHVARLIDVRVLSRQTAPTE